MIGGFIIRGPKLVFIRALGPSLTAASVNPVLADPQIQLFQNSTLLRQNNDWQSAPNANEMIATTIPPQNAKEAAILIRLEPGSYTTVVSGADGGTGIALVEVYELDRDQSDWENKREPSRFGARAFLLPRDAGFALTLRG